MNLQDVQAQIDTCVNCIELGGPTPDGYAYIKALGLYLPNYIVITNITNPVILDPPGDNPQTYSVDEVVDVTNLQYAPGSIDMFLASSFPHNLRQTLINNTISALRPGGLLVLENILADDDIYAGQRGLIPLLDSEAITEHYSQIYQYQKA